VEIKSFVLVLYLLISQEPGYMMHPVLVDDALSCEEPHETILEHKIVKDGNANLDRFFYHGYAVFGHHCAGQLNTIEQ